MTELEPLLKRIEQLTPHFGRAQDDLMALTTRGRNRDYKGVLQNARLVLEMLLRSLISTELKQTPGKAMLDEMLNKFRQQAASGLIPTHILGHMGTVQAWGNLSSHDHSGGLQESGVRVGLEEAVTSLNSLVAILTWYKERFVPEPATPLSPVAASGARTAGGGRLVLMGGGALLALVAGLGVVAYRSAAPSVLASELRSRVDALYSERAEPVPPADCRETEPRALTVLLEVAPKLSEALPEATRAQQAAEALAVLRAHGQDWRPEGWFHVARASLLAGNPDGVAMNAARLCAGFAAAENLAGRMAATSRDWRESAERYARAAELEPRFWKPRYNLGLIHLQQQRADEAVPLLERAVELAPDVAETHFFLGHAYTARAAEAQASGRDGDATADRDRARAAWCRAKERGHPPAAVLCKQ